MINALLWTPLAFGIVGLFLPKRASGWWATLGAVATLVIAAVMVVDFDSGNSGLQHTVDVAWISGLGVDYSLGIDGLNLFLVVLTALLWLGGTAFAAFRHQDRPNLFFFLMLLAETATLGAFLAQDLLLFVLFFDFMLVPFYFLFGSWGSDREGGPTAAAATLKMMIYTLIGSLLMLVGAIAAAVISADGGNLTFSLAAIQQQGHRRREPALDLLVLRRRLPGQDAGLPPARLDARRLPSGTAAGPRRLLRGAGQGRRLRLPAGRAAALPRRLGRVPGGDPGDRPGLDPLRLGDGLHPDQRAADRRLLLGRRSSASSPPGIFALRADGADGAILQMVNHGLVVAPIFVIVAILVERTGSEDIREMGGMALRAPVLAALFLIVALATLAMPGSANFIGEFYILNGLFQEKIVFACVAITGVAMSAYYALRLYQRTMHNRLPDGIASREIGLARRHRAGAAGPLHPRPRPLPAADPPPHRPDRAADRGRRHRRRRPRGPTGEQMNFREPVIDYAGISPIIALTVGLCLVLLSAVFKPTKRVAPGLTMVTLAATAGLLIWQWGESLDLLTGALRLDDLAISISLIAILMAATCVLLSLRESAVEQAGGGEYHALLLGSVLGMVLLAQAQNLVTFFVAIEILSIPLYILCATNLRREGSLESGLKYLIVGSVGSATLLYGMAFLYGGTGSTGFDGIANGIASEGCSAIR